MTKPVRKPRVILTVFRTEVRRLLRDTRALFTAVILPMLLYPVMFLGMDRLEEVSESSLDGRSVRVAYDLHALDEELATRVLERLEAADAELELAALELGSEQEAAALVDDAFELFLEGRAPDRAGDLPRAVLVFDRSSTLSNEAEERVGDVLRELQDEIRTERVVRAGLRDPAEVLAVERQDVAAAEDAAGRNLGRWLPFLAILMLISGGSFAALDAFAGERERGTLETLLVHPTPGLSIAIGKFLVVLATGTAALVGNLASFALTLELGLGKLAESAAGGAPPLARMGLAVLAFLPTALLLTALLCLVSARARSFREGQNYVMPLALLAMGPAALSTVDRVELTSMLALVPIAGPAVLVRDVLSGAAQLGPALLCVLASAVYSVVALSRLAHTLDAERLLSDRPARADRGRRGEEARRALRYGLVAIGVVYIVGGRLQAWNPVWGLVLTLWVCVTAIAFVYARGRAGREDLTLASALGLRLPSWKLVAVAACAAPAVAFLNRFVFELQERVLPAPELALPEALTSLSPLALVLLVALSPGICEELLFRGALQNGLAKDLPPVRVVLWQALLFGAVHASIYRFVPTALVGALLALLTLRARSVVPAMVLHTSYNALLALELLEGPGAGLVAGFLLVPAVFLWLRSARP